MSTSTSPPSLPIPTSFTSSIPLRTNPPTSIPPLGLGIYQSPPHKCIQTCLTALSLGYRHIDSAQFYGNEAEMGEAVIRSGIPRGEVFLTTKIMAPGGSAEKTYAKCLGSVVRIGRGVAKEGEGGREEGDNGYYVDLFLIHTPSGGPAARKEMWLALERLYVEGKARAIGVSNYGVGHIEEMRAYATVWPPHVNQIELHPFCQQRTISTYCTSNAILLCAYSPLIRNRKSSSPVLVRVARDHDRTPAQVLIRYALQKGWVPLPKSDDPGRIEENGGVWGWGLSEGEMEVLDGLDEGEGGAVVQAVRNG